MKKILIMLILLLGSLTFANANIDKMLGEWIGNNDSIITITKKNGKYFYSYLVFEVLADEGEDSDEYLVKDESMEVYKDKYLLPKDSKYYIALENNKLKFYSVKDNKLFIDNLSGELFYKRINK